MSVYVPIERYFRDVDGDAPTPMVRSLLGSRGLRGAPTWQALLDGDPMRPLVLIAPSGTGKSAEMKHQAEARRERGLYAIYADAADLVESVEGSLTAVDLAAYDAWKGTTEDYLEVFVDAVDELYRRNKRLRDLWRVLERTFDMSARKVRFVVSARTGAWDANATKALANLCRSADEKTAPRLVTFAPLDMNALRSLISAHTSDVSPFMASFEENELESLLDLRPADAELLARLWNRTRSLERWSQLLSEVIEESLAKVEPHDVAASGLTLGTARHVLTRIAAANVLLRLPQIAAAHCTPSDGVVSSRRLLDDLTYGQQVELLQASLFQSKGSHSEALQLQQGAMTSFLAARWFADRGRKGMSPESLRDALLVRVFDEERFRVPSAHRDVVGWVASEVPAFRKLMLAIHPAIALYEGDPDRLADAEVCEGLSALAARLLTGRERDSMPTRATLRRIARPAVEAHVRELLRQYDTSVSVQRHLLKLVEAGRFATCADLALARARNTSLEGRDRAIACAAAFHAGDAQHRQALASLSIDPDVTVRTALLRNVVPELLNGAPLVAFLVSGGDITFAHYLESIAKRISVVDLDLAIDHLSKKLGSNRVDSDTENQFTVLVPLLTERLQREERKPPFIVDALFAVEGLTSHYYLPEESRAQIEASLVHDGDLRRDLWKRRLTSMNVSRVFNPVYGAAIATDIAWLWSIRGQHSHAVYVADQAWRRLRDVDQRSAEESADGDLREHLQELRSRAAQQQTEEVSRSDREQENQRVLREANIAALSKRRAEIEAGRDIDAMVQAYGNGRHATRGDLDFAQLRPLVGDEFVEVFRRGFIASWRQQQVELPRPGDNSSLVSYAVGLTGIGLEVQAGLDPATLNATEAALATRYALYELNALPFWLEDLLEHHRGAVVAVLSEAITSGWDHPGLDHHNPLRFAGRSSEPVARALRSIALHLFRQRPPAYHETAQWTVDALLTSREWRSEILGLIGRELARDGKRDKRTLEWVRLWAHMEPQAAAAWLSNLSANEPDEGARFTIDLAERLEHDLDERMGMVKSSDLMAPSALGVWARLILPVVRFEDDVHAERLRMLGPRDFAARFRDRCMTLLAGNVTPEAHAVLQELVRDATVSPNDKDTFTRMIEAQHEKAADAYAAAWTEEDVLRVERGDERMPRTLEHLFTVTLNHLEHVARLVENDEFSYRNVFKKGTAEREIQLWVASCLRARANGLYNVVRENVVDHNKEVDISTFAPGIGYVPVEIKPADSYSQSELVNTVEEQLIGKYMRPPDRTHGVLLLARLWRQTWGRGKNAPGFARLIASVQAQANVIATRHGKIVRVIGVDFVAADSRTKAK